MTPSRELLLDSHVLLWFDAAPERISETARAMMLDRRTQVFVSAMSAYELAIKHHLGRLPAARGLLEMWDASLREYDFQELPFGASVARRAGALSGAPLDPFDRAIVASAQVHGFTLVTADAPLRAANWVSTLW